MFRRFSGVGQGRRGGRQQEILSSSFNLLDFTTFDVNTRATEAAFVDPRPVANGGTGAYPWDFVGADLSGNWKGTGVARIFTDGAVLIEGARTNLVTDGRDLTDVTGTGTDGSLETATAGHLDGPDAASNTGTRLECDSGGFTNYSTHTGLTADATYTGSMYQHKSTGGASSFEGGLEHTSVVGDPFDDLTLESTWKRTVAVKALTGNNTTSSLIPADGRTLTAIGSTKSAEDVTVDLLQLEEAYFPSSPIRTSGGSATRNVEVFGWANATQEQVDNLGREGGWTMDVWPSYSSTEVHEVNATLMSLNGNALRIYNNGASGNDWGMTNGATNIICAGVAFAQGDQLRFHVTVVNGGSMSLRVENLTQTLDSTAATGTGVSSTWLNARLYIGSLTTTTVYPADCVIHQPVAA